MGVEIVRYTEEWTAAVREFNLRLRAGGAAEFAFPESSAPGWMPRMELFVAVEGEAVRGGYILRRQQFWFAGEVREAAHYRLPMSEGVVNRAYAALGLRLVRDAVKREPRLYSLGMGGRERPLPRMLERLGWQVCDVPFYFKVAHPYRFLRQIRVLRTSFARRLLSDLAAFSGAGWLGLRMAGLTRRVPESKYEAPAAFGAPEDGVWEHSRDTYAMLAGRDAATIEELYPACDERFLRVRVGGGWAVALDTAMHGHKQFGDLRVGTIVDGLAPPHGVASVIRAATHMLERRGVDLIVSNQLHAAWGDALRAAGFRQGASNFLLAVSPALAASTGGADAGEFHVNRGDGAGPIHL